MGKGMVCNLWPYQTLAGQAHPASERWPDCSPDAVDVLGRQLSSPGLRGWQAAEAVELSKLFVCSKRKN